MARARMLPELASVREEHAADLIGPWADAVERLHAGIVFHAGLKSPIIEALFPHRKFDSLRRGNLENAQIYGAEFHRRRLTIRSTQVSTIPAELSGRWTIERRRRTAAELLTELDLTAVATHTFPFERAADAFAALDGGAEGLVHAALWYQ